MYTLSLVGVMPSAATVSLHCIATAIPKSRNRSDHDSLVWVLICLPFPSPNILEVSIEMGTNGEWCSGGHTSETSFPLSGFQLSLLWEPHVTVLGKWHPIPMSGHYSRDHCSSVYPLTIWAHDAWGLQLGGDLRWCQSLSISFTAACLDPFSNWDHAIPNGQHLYHNGSGVDYTVWSWDVRSWIGRRSRCTK